MSSFRKGRAVPPPPSAPCAHAGCAAPGDYKAPKSRDKLGDYQWLCLDHVREFNKQWDYFEDYTPEEIEAFVKSALTGHRPTWKIAGDPDGAHAALEDALNRFFDSNEPMRKGGHPDPKVRKALSVMELTHPVTLAEIKATYKKLVKKYHPDVNQGDKDAEERFKQITVANQVLLATYK